MNTERIEEKIRDVIVFIRGGAGEEIPVDMNLFDFPEEENLSPVSPGPTLGFDSLDGLELILGLQEEFDIEVPEDLDMRMFRTVRQIAQAISALLDSKAAVEARLSGTSSVGANPR